MIRKRFCSVCTTLIILAFDDVKFRVAVYDDAEFRERFRNGIRPSHGWQTRYYALRKPVGNEHGPHVGLDVCFGMEIASRPNLWSTTLGSYRGARTFTRNETSRQSRYLIGHVIRVMWSFDAKVNATGIIKFYIFDARIHI